MLADDVDDPRPRLLGVVKVRETIRQSRPQMKKRRSRALHHAIVSVRGPRDDSLEQSQDASDPLDMVQSCDEMHFRCTGIREADVNAAGDERPRQALSTIHE